MRVSTALEKTEVLRIPLASLDVTQPLIQAIARGKRDIIIPDITGLTIQTGKIVLTDHITIRGENKNVTMAASASTGSGDANAVFTAISKVGITLKKMKFTGLTTGRGVLSVRTTKKIRMRDIDAGSMCLFWSERISFFTEYQFISSATASRDIVIEDCIGTGDVNRTWQFIELRFCYDARVKGCDAKNYLSGVQWWGGDANSQSGSDWNSAERKCANLLIEANRFVDMEQAAVWGAMGTNILVSGNYGARTGDVMYDAEGCFDTTFIANYGENSQNGIGAIFFGARNVRFIGNNFVFTDMATWANEFQDRCFFICSYNGSGIPTRQKGVVIENNTFRATGICPDGRLAVIGDMNGCMYDPVIRNNRIENGSIELSASNNVYPQVIGNQIDIQISTLAKQSIIAVGRTHYGGVSGKFHKSGAYIKDNIINVLAPQFAGSAGILCYEETGDNAFHNYYVEGNIISADDGVLSKGILVKNVTTNTGGGMNVYVGNNILPADCDITIEDFNGKVGATTSGSNVIQLESDQTAAGNVGQLIQGPGIPANTTVTAFNSTAKTITISANATATASDQIFRLYAAKAVRMHRTGSNRRGLNGAEAAAFPYTLPAKTLSPGQSIVISTAITAPTSIWDTGFYPFDAEMEVYTPASPLQFKAKFMTGTGGPPVVSVMQMEITNPALPTWTASTAYLVGEVVVNGANIYRCNGAGTSAASGGPTGTGNPITDNTATWAYVAVAAVTLPATVQIFARSRLATPPTPTAPTIAFQKANSGVTLKKVVLCDDWETDSDGLLFLQTAIGHHKALRYEIVGVEVTSKFTTSAPAVRVLLDSAGLVNVPIGYTNRAGSSNPDFWPTRTRDRFGIASEVSTSGRFATSQALLRQMLVTYPGCYIVTGGFMNGLQALLQSTSADGSSALAGLALVTAQAPKLFSGLARRPPASGLSENNSVFEPAAANYLCANWPLPIVFYSFPTDGDFPTYVPKLHVKAGNPASDPFSYAMAQCASTRTLSGITLNDVNGERMAGDNPILQEMLDDIEGVAGAHYTRSGVGTLSINASTGVGTWTMGSGQHVYLNEVTGGAGALAALEAEWQAVIDSVPLPSLANSYRNSQSLGSTVHGTGVITADAAVAPDGTTTADRITASSNGGCNVTIAVEPLTTYSWIFDIRKTPGGRARQHICGIQAMNAATPISEAGAMFNTTTGLSYVAASVATPLWGSLACTTQMVQEDDGPDATNHWRCRMTVTTPANCTSVILYHSPANGNSGTAATRDNAGGSTSSDISNSMFVTGSAMVDLLAADGDVSFIPGV